MSKPKKFKVMKPAAAFALSEEVKRVHLLLAELRAQRGAEARSKWIAESALVLKELTQRAEGSGLSLGGVLAGPVRFVRVRSNLTSSSMRTPIALLRRKSKTNP